MRWYFDLKDKTASKEYLVRANPWCGLFSNYISELYRFFILGKHRNDLIKSCQETDLYFPPEMADHTKEKQKRSTRTPDHRICSVI